MTARQQSVSRFPELRTHALRARVSALGCKLIDSRDGDAHIEDPRFGELVMEIADVERWCDGRATNSHHIPEDAPAWLAGADIAIDLLEEGVELGLSELALQDDCRAGRAQSNVFLLHLLRLRALNDPTSDAAFCAVMSEYVGLYADWLTMQTLIDESREPIATTAEGLGHG